MKIKLSNELINSVKKGNTKTVKLIRFLIIKGFTTDKPIMETALKDMKYNNERITSCKLDMWTYELNIILEV